MSGNLNLEFDKDSGQIFVGGPVTGPAIWAVGEFLVAAYDGDAYEIFKIGQANGFRFSIEVIPNPWLDDPESYDDEPF